MEKTRTLLGDAPRLLTVVGPALIAATAAQILFPDFGSFTLRFRGPFVWAAIVLIALAVPFWISAAVELLKAWKTKKLAVRGAFGLCRHPIFAAWIWFVLPVLAFLLDSWYFLAADIVFVIAAVGGARREEAQLQAEFGGEYAEYRGRVRALVPIPRFRPFALRRYLKAAAGLAVGAVYVLLVTALLAVPVARRLGTSGAERTMQLPGDELAPSPEQGYTQAISINAPPEKVWPWLVQVGFRRAGWYNIDGINRMASPDYFIDGDGSSNRIHPELQDLKVGDSIGIAPGLSFRVVAIEPNRYFTMATEPAPGVSDSDPGYMKSVWTFYLSPSGGSTRLIVRYRTELAGGFFSNFWIYFFNDIGGAMLQQPAMLYGVKTRAERM
ncbi:hypothetical protein [Salinispira pacifica]